MDNFCSEVNQKNKETDANYKKLLYKEALRTGFFELQAVRDKYRERTINETGMHHDLIFQFIELQTILLSPICPHTAEHVFQLIGKEHSILLEKWPAVGLIDEGLLQKSSYLMETARSFRLQKKSYLQSLQKKVNKNTVISGGGDNIQLPTHAIIWISKTFPPWQASVLTTLSELYTKFGHLPDNKILSGVLSEKNELKSYMKKVMPFVQSKKVKLQEFGLEAVRQTLSFDEKDLLNSNIDYLKSTLELTAIQLGYSNNDYAPSSVKEECSPGDPHIKFSVEEETLGFKVKLINIDAQNALFAEYVKLSNGDSIKGLIINLMGKCKRIKKQEDVSIKSYKDPVNGPRQITTNDDLEILNDKDVFEVDETTRTAYIKRDKVRIYTGDIFVYCVKNQQPSF